MAVNDILMPWGRALGSPGPGRQVRELAGSAEEAQDLFDALVAGGFRSGNSSLSEVRAMPNLEEMKRDLLAECRDDHVGLWAVIRYVEDEFPTESPQRVPELTLKVIRDLLESGQMEAGFPDLNGRDFHRWKDDADAAIERIARQWPMAEKKPNVGEVAWFTSDPKVPS